MTTFDRQVNLGRLKQIFLALLLTMIANLGIGAPAIAQPLHTPLVASIFHFAGTRPDNLGITAGKLAACPPTPNCVSSQSQDAEHRIAPLPYPASGDVIQKLAQVVQDLPGGRVVQTGDRYLYAEFTSQLMGFVDDVEFSLDQANQVVQVRSASRLGESDLGVNRKRVEAIRAKLPTWPRMPH